MPTALGETHSVTAVDDEPLSRPPASGGSHRSGGEADTRGRSVRDDMSRPGPRWLTTVLLVAGLTIAVLPAVLAAHRALDAGWRPVADNPRLAVAASAFATGHPPLLGAESTSLEDSTHITPIYHPGPAESWFLGTVQTVWPGTRSMVVSAAALAAAAAAVVVLAARRIAGPWAALIAGAVVGQVAARLGTPILADIWNPYVAILPFAAALAAAAAWRFDRWRPGLPLAVLFATISVQSHITYAPLLIAALIPPAIVFGLDRRAARQREAGAGQEIDPDHDPGPVAPDGPRGRPTRLVAPIVAIVIGLVLWFPPVLSEATGHQSNVANLVRAATKDTGERALGTGYALHVFDRVAGRPPPFGPPAIQGGVWLVSKTVTAGVAVRVLLVLLLMLAVLIHGLRRRDRVTLVIGASVLATDLIALALLRFSTFSAGAALYQTRWLWAVAILQWGGLGVAVLHIARQWSWPGPGQRSARTAGPALLAAAVVVVVAGAALAATVRPVRAAGAIPIDLRNHMAAAAELQSGVRRSAGRHQRLIFQIDALLSPSSDAALNTASALIAEGADVKLTSADPELRTYFGGHYAARAGEPGELLVSTDRRRAGAMRQRGFEPVAETPALRPAERRRLQVVTGRLRAELRGSNVGWSSYGHLVHLFKPAPDFDQLLRANRLGVSIGAGELQGRLPATGLVDEFTSLQRRALPESSFVVWRKVGTAG